MSPPVAARASASAFGLALQRSSATPGVAQLRVLSDDADPAPATVRALIAEAAADPAITTVRTSALFPSAAARFAELGFVGTSTLALLRLDLRRPERRHPEDPLGARSWSTHSARRSELERLAAIDGAAFGAGWSHDAGELKQICSATPVHRMRVRCRSDRRPWRRRQLVGFAVAGATATHGYLQRLSIVPTAHRQGHGAALTLDAVDWMRRRRLEDCLVNTSVDNDAALGLYDRLGFVRLSEVLAVMELDVTTRRDR